MESVALFATIVAGIAAVYAVMFGSTPISELFKREKDASEQETLESVTKPNESVVDPKSTSVDEPSLSRAPNNTKGSKDDEYVVYELGMQKLVDAAKQRGHPNIGGLRGLQFRMKENISKARLDGDSDNLRSNRNEIIRGLEVLSKEITGQSFAELCELDLLPFKLQTDQALKHVSVGGPKITEETLKVIQLVESSKYEEAVMSSAEAEKSFLPEQLDSDEQLSLAEFHLWRSHALMYVGETQLATSLLESVISQHEEETHRSTDIRWNRILGRAHNHIGYINWMYAGRYEQSLHQFAAALPYFSKGRCHDEHATALDNMGRVYGQIGHQSLAMLLIERGRTLRERIQPAISDSYRYGLSLHSSAVVHLTFGFPYRSLYLCEEALNIFSNTKAKHGWRGIGLVRLTMGTAERYLSTFWRNRNPDESENHLVEAEKNLREALKIFGAQDREAIEAIPGDIETVDEPIRLVQAFDELGCIYRERFLLNARLPDFDKAKYYLEKSINESKSHGYKVALADSEEDLAETYYLVHNYDETRRCLDSAEKHLGSKNSTRVAINPIWVNEDEQSEDYWEQLGKIHMLRGHTEIAILISNKPESQRITQTRLKKAIEEYVIALSHFERFLARPFTNGDSDWLFPYLQPELAHHRIFTEQILTNFSLLSKEQRVLLRDRILPAVCNRLGVRDGRVCPLLKSSLDFLIELPVLDESSQKP